MKSPQKPATFGQIGVYLFGSERLATTESGSDITGYHYLYGARSELEYAKLVSLDAPENALKPWQGAGKGGCVTSYSVNECRVRVADVVLVDRDALKPEITGINALTSFYGWKAANFHDTRHLWQSRKPCPCNACLSGDLLSALTACEYSGTADAGGWNETSTRALSAAEVDIDEAALQGQANDWLAAADVEHVVALRSEPSNADAVVQSDPLDPRTQKRRVQLVMLTEKPDGSGLLRFKRLVSQAGDEVQSRSADTRWELPAGAVTETENLGCACTSLEPGSHFTWNSNTHAKNARQRSIKKDCMGTFSAAGLLELELVAFENFAVRMDGE